MGKSKILPRLCAISSKNKLKATHNLDELAPLGEQLCAISSKNKLKATHNLNRKLRRLARVVRNIFKEQIESNSQL